jgi:hypothetical protein
MTKAGLGPRREAENLAKPVVVCLILITASDRENELQTRFYVSRLPYRYLSTANAWWEIVILNMI